MVYTSSPSAPTTPRTPFVPFWALFACMVLAGQTSCGDPCRDLSDTICNCMPTRSQQQVCRKRVHALAAQGPTSNPSKDAQNVCQSLLERCTCEALAAGDFAACGLAQDE